MPLKWAFNSATVMPLAWDTEFELWRRFGWSAVEVWYDKIVARLARNGSAGQLARQLRDAGIVSIALCAGRVWTQTARADEQVERDEFARRLDMCASIGAPSITVIVTGQVGDDLEVEYAAVADHLRDRAEMASSRGVRINLEFLGKAAIHATLGSCIDLIQAVDHPAVGMLFDLCHYYVSASHLEELEQLPRGKLFLVHVDDARRRPMEALRNDERTFPGEGRIDVPGLLRAIQQRAGYDGWFSVELYDRTIWAMDPAEVFARLGRGLRAIEAALEG